MTKENRLKSALITLGLTENNVEEIANGNQIVVETLAQRTREYAVSYMHADSDATEKDYYDFTEGVKNFMPWEPFENFDRNSRQELAKNMQHSLERWFKPKLTEVEKNEIQAAIEYVQYVTVSNIKWDADNIEDVKHLPTELEVSIPLDMLQNEADSIDEVDEVAEEWISEYLSDKYHFTHDGFSHNFRKNLCFQNSFQDYMNRDGEWVPEEMTIGYETNGEIKLLNGIFIADFVRTEYLNFDAKK